MTDQDQGSTHTHLRWRDIEKKAAGTAPTASKRVPAGVFGILLGSLGIHKFYLGYTGPGLVLLLLTVLSLGFLSPVTGLIGLIEGILYLTKSDEEFAAAYVQGRRSWF